MQMDMISHENTIYLSNEIWKQFVSLISNQNICFVSTNSFRSWVYFYCWVPSAANLQCQTNLRYPKLWRKKKKIPFKLNVKLNQTKHINENVSTIMDLRPLPYCDFYKHLLVEELYYIQSPLKLHYGLCSVIGRITFQNYRYLLQNICSSFLGGTLPTGAVSVQILPRHHTEMPLENQYVELFGEAVLLDKNYTNTGDYTEPPLTSGFLVKKLARTKEQLEIDQEMQRLSTDNDAVDVLLQREIDAIREQYEPAIYLDSFTVIDSAAEVIQCNLHLRAIQIMKRAWAEDYTTKWFAHCLLSFHDLYYNSNTSLQFVCVG